MFRNDYILDQIELLSSSLAKVIFHKEIATVEIVDELGVVSTEGFLFHRVCTLIEQGSINEAENLIFEELQENNSNALLQTALRFYDELNKLSDESLFACDYSREEIFEGMTAIQKICEVHS